MEYKEIAKEARIKVLEMIYKAQTSHIGSNFSVIDLATVLYEKADLKKDKIIWSAGWKAATAYYFLARKGIIPERELETYCRDGSKYIGLLEPTVPGISCAGGSMGYGLPFAVGFALAKKLKKEEGTIYVLMSDGEMAIGTTYESALIAAHHKLDNLVVIVDYNGFQAMGPTNEILNIEPLEMKWRSFGWNAYQVDGHDWNEIEGDFRNCVLNTERKIGQPSIMIAHTIKGKGVSFMENRNEWHYRSPSKVEYQEALKELNK